MAGLLNSLNAARTSLEVNQKSIEIIGNNISNVNTEGYSRQQAELTSYPSLSFGDFFIGQGVKITDISRQHDVFIDRQIKQKAVDLGFQDALSRPLSDLERIFSVSEDNISTDTDVFFDAMQKLSADPADPVLRNNVILQGQVLAKSFKTTVNELDSVKRGINESITSKLESINSQLNEIARLNDRIYTIEIQGQTANSARDQRDLLAKELAKSIGAQSFENSKGILTVHLPGGLPLVQGTTAMTVSAKNSGDLFTLQLEAGGVKRNLDSSNTGGEVGGLIDIRENLIPELQGEIDKLAYELSVQVNIQHQAGGGLDSSTGNLFFNMPPGYILSPPSPPPTAAEYAGAARQMHVVITDPAKIAAGAAPDPGPPPSTVALGDNRNALILSNIGDTYLINGTETFNSVFSGIVANVGIESRQNQLSLKGAQDAMIQLENFRDGLVGVSLEEEMIDLIRFQRGFESSAKFLSTIDEMMDTVINLKR
ncbi:MAG: flagellar hook-associated protein FlgK [Deltaproteobacteria bacterium]|nr:flagellar hook-associated protein FlgK [Deltaproteobacteria bacterium]